MFKKYTIIVFTWLTLFMEVWCFLITWQMIFTTDLTFNNQIYMYELSSLMHHWYHSIIQYPCTRCLRNMSNIHISAWLPYHTEHSKPITWVFHTSLQYLWMSSYQKCTIINFFQPWLCMASHLCTEDDAPGNGLISSVWISNISLSN